MGFEDFTQMHVYQIALDLLVRIYQETKHFPSEEKFGMISDMRRAANTITHNIAEGFGRFEPKDKTRFYKISRGSAFELMSQNIACSRLEYQQECVSKELNLVCKKIIEELNAIIKSLENS